MGIHVVRGHGRFTSGERGQMRGRCSVCGPSPLLGTVFLFLHGACVGLSRIRTTCHHPTGYHHHPAGLILGGRERLHAVTFTIHHRSRSMDRRGVGGTHTALIFSTSSSLLYSFFKGEAAAAVSSSSSSHLPSFPRRHCSSYRDQDIEFALRLQLSHFAPLTLTAWGNSTYESGSLPAHPKSGKILLFYEFHIKSQVRIVEFTHMKQQCSTTP